MMQVKEASSMWFKLPGEIRNMIYRELLSDPESEQHLPLSLRIYYNPESAIFLRRERPSRGLGVAMLRTCRRVHDEAAEILYGENILCLYHSCPEQLERMLECIGPANARHIRHVRVLFNSHALVSDGYSQDNDCALINSYRSRPLRTTLGLGGGRLISNPLEVLVKHCPHLERLVFHTADILDPQFTGTTLRLLNHRGWEAAEAASVKHETVAFARMDTHIRESFPRLQSITMRPDSTAKDFSRRHRSTVEDLMLKAGWVIMRSD